MKGPRAGRDASSPFLVISLSGGFRETNRICFSRRMEHHDGDSGVAPRIFALLFCCSAFLGYEEEEDLLGLGLAWDQSV